MSETETVENTAAENPMEEIPDIEEKPDPTIDLHANTIGDLQIESNKKKVYEFNLPNYAKYEQLRDLLGSLMTFHVDEDHKAFALIKHWGWPYKEDKVTDFTKS